MWASGLVSLGIGEGVFVQGSWPTPVINAILSGKRRSILLFHWKLSPQCSCSGIPGGRTGAGSGERACLSSIWDLVTGVGGKSDAVPGLKSFLPHTPGRWLHWRPSRHKAMCLFPHQPSKWLLSQLWQSLFSNRKRFLKTLFVWRAKPAPC